MTKVRAEDKNLTLFRSDEVCVFYEIRFLNFARWFPRSGSRKDNGVFATFFPACKVSEPLMDTSATFSETLSARWASSPLGQGQRKKKRKKERRKREKTRDSFVKPETGHHFLPFSFTFDRARPRNKLRINCITRSFDGWSIIENLLSVTLLKMLAWWIFRTF